jgi:hypothetical protein
MSEWLKEHAWKSTPLARADAHQNAPTHLQINDFRNIDARRRVLVNHRVDRGFEGVCDTVLTQCRSSVTTTSKETHRRVPMKPFDRMPTFRRASQDGRSVRWLIDRCERRCRVFPAVFWCTRTNRFQAPPDQHVPSWDRSWLTSKSRRAGCGVPTDVLMSGAARIGVVASPDLAKEPGLRGLPIPHDRLGRDVQDMGGFVDGQAAKESQLNDLAHTSIERR